MSKRFLFILAICMAIFVGLFVVNKKDAEAPNSAPATSTSHTQGENQSGVVLMEYGDFECPACGAYYPLLQEVKTKYNDEISFQFRHFPIVGSHPNAMAAHRAAEAAARQDKFWEMHDMLYENQRSWASPNTGAATIFEGYAQQIGLDVEKYKQDLASSGVKAVIDADLKQGKEDGVTGTPTFFLDGKKIESTPRTVEDFSKLIDEAIKAKSQ